MADISNLARLLNGALRQVNLSQNALLVDSLKVGQTSPVELTKTILTNLVALQNGSDFANGTNAHTHDGRYFTESELSSATASSGSDLIGDDDTYSNFTPTAATVKGALAGIDAALVSAGGTTFSDADFIIYNDVDNSKELVFDVSAVATSTTRTISMPNANVDLAKVNTAIQRDGSVAFTANQPMGSFKLTGLAAGSTAGDSVRYEQAILTSGANAFAANQPMGGFKLTGLAAGSGAGDSVRYEQAILVSGANAFTANQSFGGFKATSLADPTSAQDAATKAYVDNVAAGIRPKEAVRAASTADVDISTELENGDSLDGVTLATGDRVLLKDQTDASENGIYVVVASGAASRSTDFDSLTPIDEINGSWIAVQEGTQAGIIFVQYGTVATLGTDDITFTYLNSLSSLVGGDMITVTGSTISVDLAAVSGLESSNPGNAAGQLRVKLEASNPSLRITGSNELAAKLDAAGAIASGASGLAVQVDNSTIEINTNALRIKDAGVTLAKLASNSVDENKLTTSVAGNGLSGGGGSALAVNVDDSTIEINSDSLRVKDAGITAAKLNTNVADQATITGGAGSALAVQYSPQVKKTVVAGETFAANTSFLVRWALNGETAGRVYKADDDASSSDEFYVVGIVHSAAGVTAGQNIDMVSLGSHTLGSSDTPFNSADVGKPVFLTTSGAFSVTAPSGADIAVFRAGLVESTTKIWMQPDFVAIDAA